MTRIWSLLLVLFILSCNEKKPTSVANDSENNVTSKEEPAQQPASIAIKLYAFSEIVYTKLSRVYVPEKNMDNYTTPGYYQTLQEDFVNLGKIEEIPGIPTEDSKYKYLDAVEQRLRQRFDFSNGMSWKIKSRELYIFDTYTAASKSQLKIREQDTPRYSE